METLLTFLMVQYVDVRVHVKMFDAAKKHGTVKLY